MEPPVEARLVGELTKMGFAAELSQRAVLHTNAAGLQAALDWLVASAADEPPPARPQASEEDMLAAAIAASLEPADDPSARRGRASPDELSEAEILAAEAQFERLSAAGWSTDSVDGGDAAPASWPPLPDALLDDGAQELMLRRLERAPSATVIAKAALVFRRRALAARKRAGSGETLGAVRSPPRRGGEAGGAGGEGASGGAEGAAVSVTSHEQTIFEGNLLLRQRLTQLGLQNVSVGDDGNCQFRAI
ncbi:hypothetical protein AB1Y20_012276 [Prymnesium parvum]|uniref:Uncharacterized protein n=1 Tax=Prymnesium parvum TaxID=97485 RepID=A0AB34IQF1_PRYPA